MDDHKEISLLGSRPEYGAIFMSNKATKRECLRRRVFALPSSQSHFVKQVKTGMILFLFEYERRELHGVFQACSDGDMNILPHAFSLSGKQYPAQDFIQVEFTPLWYCDPLSESEFRDAIRENYFSKNKFKFGLSEDQVRRLLLLFSSKRLDDDQAPQWQLSSRRNVGNASEYSTRKIRRRVDNDRSPMSNQVLSESDVDYNHGPVISSMHHRDSLYIDDRAADEGRFGSYTDVGYKHKASAFLDECFQDLMGKVGQNIDAAEYTTSDRLDIQRSAGIEPQPPVSVGYSLGDYRSTSSDDRFAKSDRLETECYNDDGFASTISTAFPSSLQFKVSPHAYTRKHVLETDSFVHELSRPSSTFLPSMELRDSRVSYPRTFEDSIVTSALPYDPDAPNINYRGSSSMGFDRGHASLQEYASRDSFARNVFSSSTNQSFPSSLETRTTITPDVNSGSRDFMSLPYSDQYERPGRTSLPGHAYSDMDIASEYSKKEFHEDLPILKPSLAPVPSEIRNSVRMSEHPSSYRISPSKFPSLTFSDRYSTLLQEKHENNAGFGNDVLMFKECQHHGDSFYADNRAIEDGRWATYKDGEYGHTETKHQLHVHEPATMDHQEVASLSPAAYKNSEGYCPDRPKKRSSVFSRLALPSKACEKESYTAPGNAKSSRNASVNEVMDMLHHNYNWVKSRSRQLAKNHDDGVHYRDKKQAIRKEGSSMISKEMNPKRSLFSKDNSSQQIEDTTSADIKLRSAVRKNLEDGKTGNHCENLENCSHKTEDTTFLNFKRRSAVRKNLGDCKAGNHCGSLENKSASASQSKRRKLIRPNFFKNESCDRDRSSSTLEHEIASSVECSVSKSAENTKVSVCHADEYDISTSENVRLLNVVSQNAVEGDNIDNGSGSNSEQAGMESLIPLKNVVEGDSFDNGSGSNSEQVSPESFIPLISTDESGKKSSSTHGISSMTSVSCGNNHIGLEEVVRSRDLGMDGLIQNPINVSHSAHESSLNHCEDNDGNGVAKNEFFYNIEQINNLGSVRAEISISHIN
ncbi:hypothetical protein COLO4_30994 [Corchorus olitorius]|uniref:DCD domain-containing protein n=1 Tax=Corchorus olitorius TaxID=93759 RepID=A0A1R3H615_9ROSI|nr:hypothetical protein COLO4_30994 [Corchorus olitorius]